MHSSSAVLGDVVIPELDKPRIRPTSDPPPGRAGDSAEVALRLVQDHDRIAEGMNDIVVHRLFSAGLSLETALGLMGGDHRGAAKVREAIGELDLAIRDFRNVLFDHQVRGDRRAISVQLARVMSGHSRLLRATRVGCSAASSAMICPIPKLIVRVRFPSPAPKVKPQVRLLVSRAAEVCGSCRVP